MGTPSGLVAAGAGGGPLLLAALAVAANATLPPPTQPPEPPNRFSIPQMVFIGIIAAILSVITVVGNCMVMISFKIDKQLQTISNYFLFSLAIADFAIGLISMPLFAVTIIMGYWPLGPHICDTWLALDYLASNASVLNLLIISFDRYFSVTRPLTYRAKRTTGKAAVMIGSAWGISLLLWPPWIYAWPYIEGERTVPEKDCYIQFIETNHYITIGTAIAAFYVPVSVMCVLYYKIWGETQKRQKDLPNLQGGKKHESKRSNSSDEATQVHPGGVGGGLGGAGLDQDDWRRARLESGTDDYGCGPHGDHRKQKIGGWAGMRAWCVAWWHSGREEYDEEGEDPSDMGYATPVSIETPLQSVSRGFSMNVIRDPYAGRGGTPTSASGAGGGPGGGGGGQSDSGASPLRPAPGSQALQARDYHSLPTVRTMSNDSVYTILIRLPPDPSATSDPERAPSIRMIHDDLPVGLNRANRTPQPPHRGDSEFNLTLNPSGQNHSRRPSHIPDVKNIPLNAKIIPKQLAGKSTVMVAKQAKKKKKTQEKKQETKAAKTLSAILLSFIITWLPYNILVLVKPLSNCGGCIPDELWDFFYALCYINSTINPMCYALCNASFRRTYVRILTCKWHNRNREGISRGVYN